MASLIRSLLLRSVLALTPPPRTISWIRGDKFDARVRQKKDGRDEVSKLCSSGWRKFGGAVMLASSRRMCGGGLIEPSRASRATMFWQRAEISRSVRSKVGKVARARASAGRDERRDVVK